MTMKKYECEPCGYIYDPAVGDPDAGIDPETAFEDIPDDWTCPILSLIHISEPTRPHSVSRMPSSA